MLEAGVRTALGAALKQCAMEAKVREGEAMLGYAVESAAVAIVELVCASLDHDGAAEVDGECGERLALCPEDAERAEELMEDPEPIRITVAEQLRNALEDEVCDEVCDAFLGAFVVPVLGSLVDSAWAQHGGEAGGGDPEGTCELCQRLIPTTRHHLVPRSQHRFHKESRGRTMKELCVTVALCRPCHSGIHRLIDEREMGISFASVDLLRAHPGVQRHVAWVGKQPVGGKAALGKRGANVKDARSHR